MRRECSVFMQGLLQLFAAVQVRVRLADQIGHAADLGGVLGGAHADFQRIGLVALRIFLPDGVENLFQKGILRLIIVFRFQHDGEFVSAVAGEDAAVMGAVARLTSARSPSR